MKNRDLETINSVTSDKLSTKTKRKLLDKHYAMQGVHLVDTPTALQLLNDTLVLSTLSTALYLCLTLLVNKVGV